VLVCSHSVPSAAAGSACSIVSSTASPSVSIVMIASAPSAASAGVVTTVMPSPPSDSAFSRDRFQARTSNPAAAMLRDIPCPIVPPAPRSATVCKLIFSAYPMKCLGITTGMGIRGSR
jgi:hypothetical protein